MRFFAQNANIKQGFSFLVMLKTEVFMKGKKLRLTIMYRKRREAAEKLLAQNRRPVKLPYKPSRLTVEQIKAAIDALPAT